MLYQIKDLQIFWTLGSFIFLNNNLLSLRSSIGLIWMKEEEIYLEKTVLEGKWYSSG